jgi:acyl carrier protein
MPDFPWSDEFEHIIRTNCGLSDSTVTMDSAAPFNLLGADSITLLNIIVDSEEAFDIQFPDELLTADTLATPGTLWQALMTVVERSRGNGEGHA